MNPVRLIGPALLFSLLTISCAKQTAPTGGPKDTIPPNLISVLPKKNTVNFSGNTIEMTFDEYINLDNPQEQILITPAQIQYRRAGHEFLFAFGGEELVPADGAAHAMGKQRVFDKGK